MTDRQQWRETWSLLNVAPPEDLFHQVIARYSEPHRCYHTRQHLRECFSVLAPASHLAKGLAQVQLALWFHDAIYDTRAHDNEEQSARWAEQSLIVEGVEADAAVAVGKLVLATKHNGVPQTEDAKLVVDVDLSILGAVESRFAEYERQIRQEYVWVADDLFRQRRAEILASLLNRASIYSTDWFASRFEEQARRNLLRSLKKLTV